MYVLDARPKNKHPPTLARKGTGRVRLQFETLNPKIRHLHFDPLNRNNKVIYYDPKDRAGEGEVSWSYSCLLVFTASYRLLLVLSRAYRPIGFWTLDPQNRLPLPLPRRFEPSYGFFDASYLVFGPSRFGPFFGTPFFRHFRNFGAIWVTF